jgi:hypothetical protein
VTATPAEVLAMARDLLLRPDSRTAGVWPRASALLARQALESAVDRYWAARGLALAECSTHAQLVCLARYLDEVELAGRVRVAWHALSDACHHRAYDLAPTLAELAGLLDVVQAFVERADA